MQKLLAILIINPLLLLAQTDKNTHNIEWNTNLFFESSSLDKSFLNKMLYGGYISEIKKTKWINSSEEKNVLFSEISNRLSYTFEKNNCSFGLSFLDRNILNTSFTDDLLRIVFEGNFNYQNKTLDFSGTSIRADRFQQYKFTYKTVVNQMKVSTSLSYLSGNNHLSYIIEKGSLYTAAFGTSLDIAYNMSAYVSDTSSINPFKNNGNGLALGLSTEFQFKEQIIHISFSDLGFIMWDPTSFNIAVDSNFYFSGIEVENILSFGDSVIQENNINEDILKTSQASFKSYVPANFYLRISGYSNYKYFKNYTLGIQAKWQPYLDNTPLSFAKIGQGFNESNFKTLYYIQSTLDAQYCNIIPTLSYGGYSSYTNLGMALSKGKKHIFTLGTHHLEDVLKKNSGKAISVYFNIKFKF